jgi:hypothetical protein
MTAFSIDRARVRRVRDIASTGGRVAWAVIKSGGRLARAVGAVAVSGITAWYALAEVRKPDSELLQQAIEAVRVDVPPTPSALEQRDLYLTGLAISVCLALAGFYWLNEWWNSLPSKWKSLPSKKPPVPE